MTAATERLKYMMLVKSVSLDSRFQILTIRSQKKYLRMSLEQRIKPIYNNDLVDHSFASYLVHQSHYSSPPSPSGPQRQHGGEVVL